MRKLIYLIFQDGTAHASFTRFDYFQPDRWAAKNNTLLGEMGVQRVEFEYVADDFYLPWENI